MLTPDGCSYTFIRICCIFWIIFFILLNFVLFSNEHHGNWTVFIRDTDDISTYTNFPLKVHWKDTKLYNISRTNFMNDPFHRIYISDKCKYIYFTTYKTGSYTTRKMIDIKQCGFGANIVHNAQYWKSCGDHECNDKDYGKLKNAEYFKIIFVRHPIARFESVYNYMYSKNIKDIKLDNLYIFNHFTGNISVSEFNYFKFIHYYYNLTMNCKQNDLWFMLRRHSQPMMNYLCVTHKNDII
eukprot:386660_1